MTQKQFQSFCKRNKPVKINSISDSETIVTFENGKQISINCGEDWFYYIKLWVKPKRNASKKLFSDINTLRPEIEKHYKERYGNGGTYDKLVSEFTSK